MSDEQVIYAECVSGPLAGDCPHQTFWAALAPAQDAAEKHYRKRMRLHQFAGRLTWTPVPAIERWELLFNGSPTNVYVETIRVQGAKVHPFDANNVALRIAVAIGLNADAEGCVREILRSL